MTTVLIVEDENLLLKTLSTILKRKGYDVKTAATSAEARAAIFEGDSNLDLLVLDIWLAGHSGLDILREIKVNKPDLPVIVMSGGSVGRPLEQDVAIADVYGAATVLIKPFQADELVAAVQSALGR